MPWEPGRPLSPWGITVFSHQEGSHVFILGDWRQTTIPAATIPLPGVVKPLLAEAAAGTLVFPAANSPGGAWGSCLGWPEPCRASWSGPGTGNTCRTSWRGLQA